MVFGRVIGRQPSVAAKERAEAWTSRVASVR
jgi:hypothetical protein